ncbi:MAG: hypothetical protein EWM72_02755 [Nitrospira sp.]|nr:MAG: hypothetical protein EWM72_02755 [Nitrospira sp.]
MRHDKSTEPIGPLSDEDAELIRRYYALPAKERRALAGLPERIIATPKAPDRQHERTSWSYMAAALVVGVVLLILVVVWLSRNGGV